jgi:tetratricopeptide (TPR) repeat protein
VKKHLYIVLFAFLLTGCVSPLKQSWNNFTAYYNTFYNAKQSFSEGVELNKRQQPEIDPSRPIRIHPSPTDAGHPEFERAIEKGASILRDHSQSSYVNRAVSLIGQSYFYRQEYFSALEKFQELSQLTDGEELQTAILWQARTYLELELYAEGVRFINQELDFIDEWNPPIMAELRSVQAQLHASNGEWGEASEALHSSVGGLDGNRLKARAYFLHGQVLERVGNNFQALAAYRLSSEIISEYDIEFNSKRKLAEMYRKTGDYDSALQLFRSLERDDKFIDYHVELRYELARTYQEIGEAQTSVNRYKRVLHDRFDPPSNRVKAKSYYGLAEIYRDQYNDFQMAAAYFDSANSQSVDLTEMYEDIDAENIARAFGEYASLKQEISRIDSLLHLASLDPAELDSVLKRVQEQQLAQSEADQQADIFVSANESEQLADATESVEFGFLNSNDPTRQAQASMRFRSIWGDRPLTDNWRRESAMIVSIADEVDEQTNQAQQAVVTNNNRAAGLSSEIGVDISEIPFSPQEELIAQQNREGLTYRLGNLFFLSLNMPDSARVYFSDVIESEHNPDLTPRAIYSMIELEIEEGNRERVQEYSDLLFQNYPESTFSKRLADRLGMGQVDESLDSLNTTEILYASLSRDFADTSYAEKARQLRELADVTPDEEKKVIILFEAAENYLKAAREESEMGNVEFDYESEYWQEAGELLLQIEELAPQSERAKMAGLLLDEIRKTEEAAAPGQSGDGVVIERFPEERYPSDPAGELSVCRDVGVQLNLAGGEARIIDEMSWNEEVRNSLPDIISYRFAINPDGSIEEFNLLSEGVLPEAEIDLNRAIQNLVFDPVGGDHSIRCKVNFPIR